MGMRNIMGCRGLAVFALTGAFLLTVGRVRAGRETFEERVRERRAELIDKAVRRGWHGHFTAHLFHPDPDIHQSGLNGLASYYSDEALDRIGPPGDRSRNFRILHRMAGVIAYLHEDSRGLPDELLNLFRARLTEVTSPFPPEIDSWIYSHGNLNWPATICKWAILAGEHVGNQEVVQKGMRNLELLAYRLHGEGPGTPGELNSPGYQGRSQRVLALMALYAQNPEIRLIAEVLLERQYLETVSRYHAPSQRLGGPWGRAYAASDAGAWHQATFPLNLVADEPPFFDDRAAGEVWGFAATGNIPLATYAALPFPDYLVWIAENKPFPYTVNTQFFCSRYSRGGPHGREEWDAGPGTTATYQTEDYVLGTLSRPYVDDGQGMVCIAHWKRADSIEGMTDFRTLYTHFTLNERKPSHANTYRNWGGEERTVGPSFWHNDGRGMVTQHKGKAVVLYHPKTFEAHRVHSMKLDVAVPLYAPLDGLYIGEKPVTDLPAEAGFEDVIFIEDADVFVAVRPLAPVQLGGSRQVYISEVEPQLHEQFVGDDGPKIQGHLLISVYNYHDPSGELSKLAEAADPGFRLNYNGLVLEIGTRTEYGSLDAFRNHIAEAEVSDEMLPGEDQAPGDEPQVRRVAYRSGGDAITAAYRLTTEEYVERTVNGRPVEPEMFESPLAVQSRSGQIAVDNTRLRYDEDVPLTLIALEGEGKYAVINPLHVATRIELNTPHGSVATPVFRRGILRFYPGTGAALVEVRALDMAAPVRVSTETGNVIVAINGEPVSAGKVEANTWQALPPGWGE